jgi:hypothetical protein
MNKISASTKPSIQTDLSFKVSLPLLWALAAEEHVADSSECEVNNNNNNNTAQPF